jgi:hypothetical protein
VLVNWIGLGGVPCKATFHVLFAQYVPAQNTTQLYLRGHDVTREFTGADSNGSTEHAYRSQFHAFLTGFAVNGAWQGQGYGAPDMVTVRVQGEGGEPTAGLSPAYSVAGKQHFSGRTIIFTHHGTFDQNFGKGLPSAPRANFAERAVETIVHEFCHALGMPHKCAHWDYKTPRLKSCCMNYGTTWLLDSNNQALPGSQGKPGASFCARHIKEVRRVGLHNNPVYRRA